MDLSKITAVLAVKRYPEDEVGEITTGAGCLKQVAAEDA